LKVLDFDNRFVRELPADLQTEPGTRQVQGAAYSLVSPTPVGNPGLLAYSPEVADLLNLDVSDIGSREFLDAFSGNALLPGMQSYAADYGGHQFGHWAGQMGYGRALGRGEVVSKDKLRLGLELNGAGTNPLSRRSEGPALVGS